MLKRYQYFFCFHRHVLVHSVMGFYLTSDQSFIRFSSSILAGHDCCVSCSVFETWFWKCLMMIMIIMTVYCIRGSSLGYDQGPGRFILHTLWDFLDYTLTFYQLPRADFTNFYTTFQKCINNSWTKLKRKRF